MFCWVIEYPGKFTCSDTTSFSSFFVSFFCVMWIYSLHQNTWIPGRMSLRSSCPEVFLRNGVLKINSKFTGEHPCRSAVRLGDSAVNLLHIFRTPLDGCFWSLLFSLVKWPGEKTVSCKNNIFVQNRATNVHNTEAWQKSVFFTDQLPVAAFVNALFEDSRDFPCFLSNYFF